MHLRHKVNLPLRPEHLCPTVLPAPCYIGKDTKLGLSTSCKSGRRGAVDRGSMAEYDENFSEVPVASSRVVVRGLEAPSQPKTPLVNCHCATAILHLIVELSVGEATPRITRECCGCPFGSPSALQHGASKHKRSDNSLSTQTMASITGHLFAISGAASGIGRATTELLAQSGVLFSLADKDDEAVQHLAKTLTENGASVYRK
jgi:hypothetical protein